ncbi:7614_t:CDS:2, partial [Paraglomus occultum]
GIIFKICHTIYRRRELASISEMATSNLFKLENENDLKKILKESKGAVVFVDFWAEWAEPCKSMNEVFQTLAGTHSNFKFVMIEAEKFADISEAFQIEAVPVFLVLKLNESKRSNPIECIERISGANAPALSDAVEKYAKASGVTIPSSTYSKQPTIDLNSRLRLLLDSSPAILFMKGTPNQPRCKFSRQMVEILNTHNVTFSSFNVLADEEVKQGLKEYSNWPTYPQLYFNGELVGGLDIVKELVASGEFQNLVPKQKSLDERLKELTTRANVMLFMKGEPMAPRCGFSRQLVEILEKKHIQFESFDILSDEEVRHGLKTYADWPTYPMLFFKGELLGGLDVVKGLDSSGELDEKLASEKKVEQTKT